MIDAHAHLHDTKFDVDRAAVIAQIGASGVTAVVSIGTSVAESRDAIELATKYNTDALQIFATVGIHPHVFNYQAITARDIIALRNLARAQKSVVSVGEIGLDYFSRDTPISDNQRQWQRDGFLAQIALAAELRLPVVVHCRDAYDDCYDIIRRNPEVQFAMHCYMGDEAMTAQLLARANVVFSFAGNVTYSKTNDDIMSRVIAQIPLERIMIETDAPYLAPVPHRGKRCDSTMLASTAAHIAQIKGVSVDKLSTATTKVAQEFFDI